jgi:hypothetical protein
MNSKEKFENPFFHRGQIVPDQGVDLVNVDAGQ